MKNIAAYHTIEKEAFAEFTDRGSRFLAYAYPLPSLSAFKDILQLLKKEHPKATHHCFAYRLGKDGLVFRTSDDGEPSGTAGRPILGQIDSKQLTDILVVVVRYFGGSLLGVPGLITAYRSVTAMVLQLTPVVIKDVEQFLSLQFDYTRLNEVMSVVKPFPCKIVQQDLQLFCRMMIAVSVSRSGELKYRLDPVKGLVVKESKTGNWE